MLNKALKIAYQAHHKQIDKAGVPYIFHPIRVALHCQTEEEKIVALLHDVVEDTLITLEYLKAEKFSSDVLIATKCLTKTKGENYQTHIQRIANNSLATKIKIQDLKDNMNVSRLEGKPHWKIGIYTEALNYLEQHMKNL